VGCSKIMDKSLHARYHGSRSESMEDDVSGESQPVSARFGDEMRSPKVPDLQPFRTALATFAARSPRSASAFLSRGDSGALSRDDKGEEVGEKILRRRGKGDESLSRKGDERGVRVTASRKGDVKGVRLTVRWVGDSSLSIDDSDKLEESGDEYLFGC